MVDYQVVYFSILLILVKPWGMVSEEITANDETNEIGAMYQYFAAFRFYCGWVFFPYLVYDFLIYF